MQDDSDEGEGGVGGKQLEAELSNLGGRGDVVAHESEDRNQPELQSDGRGQPWRWKESSKSKYGTVQLKIFANFAIWLMKILSVIFFYVNDCIEDMETSTALVKTNFTKINTSAIQR